MNSALDVGKYDTVNGMKVFTGFKSEYKQKPGGSV